MKTIYKLLFIGLFPVLFFNCSSDDDVIEPDEEIVYDLKLSVENKIHSVYSTDTVFEILRGNGEYVATVSDEDIAKVSVNDTTVNVSFISNGSVNIEITDVKGKSASVSMNVYHESLVPTHYITFIPKDKEWELEKISFGAGGYSIENIKGDHATVEVKDDKFMAKSVSHGKTYFDIVDKRGTRAPAEIWVIDYRELETDRLDIKMIPDQRTSVKTLYGEEWMIESYNGTLCEVVIIPVSNTNPTDIIQIDTFADNPGFGTIQLKDKDGKRAVITLTVEE